MLGGDVEDGINTHFGSKLAMGIVDLIGVLDVKKRTKIAKEKHQ
ncbi:hypothetical protein [Aliivibrio sp. SR45-2]|nr:hypothetical protein [Aliivibrio sp. SR45-2]